MSHPQPEPSDSTYDGDQVNAGLVGIVGLFSAVVLLLVVVLLQAWFYTWKEEFAAARAVPADEPNAPLGRMLSEQEAQISTYHWVDRKAGVRAIPIERAMAVVADEMAAARRDQPPEVKNERGR